MKKILLLISFSLVINVFSQDIINIYDPDNLVGQTLADPCPYFDGEYQIFLDELYWIGEGTPTNHLITYSIECVSFPFVPNCFHIESTTSSCISGNTARDFIVLTDDLRNYNIVNPLQGVGWSVTGGKTVYQKCEPYAFDLVTNEDESSWLSYPASLVSTAYSSSLWASNRMYLPHSVLRITLNVHETNDIISDIKVKISWLYDNTRGRMQKYPFIDNNLGTTEKERFDVTFFPKFKYDENGHYYNTTGNLTWFEGAHPATVIEPLGSINYYHNTDIINPNIPYYPPDPSVYGTPFFPWNNNSIFYYYPAPYALLSSPLRNSNGSAYAGFDNNGNYGQTSQNVDEGHDHDYRIFDPIDLSLINTDEKIIYNPSKIEVYCDLTFPEDYKFLTVHGKYPDKAWVMENNTEGFDDLRDVLCPSDQIDENGDFLSEYNINNKTLTVGQGVIIMDTKLTGNGTIMYHPDHFAGNFTFEPDFELHLYAESFHIYKPDLVLENETYFHGKYFYIESGASLTIKNSIYMTQDAKIIVKRGGKLIIDGGTITSESGQWAGIEVWGTRNQPQLPEYQGTVEIKNGGTIADADVGIRVVKMSTPADGEPAPDLLYTGGIINATNAIFDDNNIAVYFYDYTYNSLSFFSNCSFHANSSAGTTTPVVRMNNVHGIRFSKCHFNSFNNKGTGIYGYNSGFTVRGKCESNTNPCPDPDWEYGSFSNLYRGIYATTSSTEHSVIIDHINFNNNFRAVYVSGMSTPLITNNNFEINTPYVEEGGYGLYLDRSTAYKVEENNFYHSGQEPIGVGLIVNNSGTDPNIIYRNWFTKLECGMDIQGENRAKSGEGLQLKCNQYDQTTMDKIITWDEGYENPFAGIAENQGSSSSNPQDMAGNLFQIDGQTPNGDYDDILNEANHITYYYPDNSTNNDVKPVDYTENTVTLVTVPFSPNNPWTYEEGCPENESGGGGTGTDDGLRNAMAQSDQKIDSTENLLAMLIDGGNTETVQTQVNNSVPPQTMDVYNELMNKSPYLSDTVIATAIEKEDVLPAAMIRDIMVANPKSAKSDILINKLDERWNPLPDYMKGQILQGRSIVSIREETESRLSAFRLERAGYFNALVRYYLNDTVNPQASLDSLKAVLQTENSLNAKYMLAFLQAQQGDWSQGIATLSAIPSAFELTSAQQTIHQQMTGYFNLLSNLAADNKSVMEADSTQIATLKTIEQAGAGIVGVYARNILLALNESDYEEPVILPDMLKAAMISDNYQKLINKAKQVTGMLTVRPNPAKDFVIVGYEFEKETDAVIVITGTDGKKAYTGQVNGLKDQLTVDTRKWKAGVYIAVVKINDIIKESVKFTVVK